MRRLVLPGVLCGLGLLLQAASAKGPFGAPRPAAGTARWLCGASFAARLAALLLTGRPKLMSDLVGAALFLAAGVPAAQPVFDLPATALIATSPVLIAGLGFALRRTLADIVSGIALGMDSPCAIGGRIGATEGRAGRPTGIAWPSTRLAMREGVTLVVPISLVAGHRIAVHGAGEAGRFRAQVAVPLGAAAPPARARRILLAAAPTRGHILAPLRAFFGFR